MAYSEKTEVISKLNYVRSTDENVGGSVFDIFWKSEAISKLYITYGSLTKTWVVQWLAYFGKTQEIGKLKLRAIRQRNEGGTVGAFLVLGIRSIFVASYGGRKVESERLNRWLLVAFELLMCVDMY